MTTQGRAERAGHARYTFRVRLSVTARRLLEAEWDRCRWVWDECVAKSQQVHRLSRAAGEKVTCGPAQLDRMLTEARGRTPWLAEGLLLHHATGTPWATGGRPSWSLR